MRFLLSYNKSLAPSNKLNILPNLFCIRFALIRTKICSTQMIIIQSLQSLNQFFFLHSNRKSALSKDAVVICLLCFVSHYFFSPLYAFKSDYDVVNNFFFMLLIISRVFHFLRFNFQYILIELYYYHDWQLNHSNQLTFFVKWPVLVCVCACAHF